MSRRRKGRWGAGWRWALAAPPAPPGAHTASRPSGPPHHRENRQLNLILCLLILTGFYREKTLFSYIALFCKLKSRFRQIPSVHNFCIGFSMRPSNFEYVICQKYNQTASSRTEINRRELQTDSKTGDQTNRWTNQITETATHWELSSWKDCPWGQSNWSKMTNGH